MSTEQGSHQEPVLKKPGPQFVEEGGDDFSHYPVTVTLHFKDELAKKEFMGQLNEGVGDDFIDVHWPWVSRGQHRPGNDTEGYEEQDRYAVEII